MESSNLTIGIPAYNCEKDLPKLLESLSNIKNIKYEIIIINDGSKDNTLAVCKKYASKNRNIKIYSQKNKGVSHARNEIIKRASGEWITFIDSDDNIVVNVFEEFINKALENHEKSLHIAIQNINKYNRISKKNEKLPLLIENEIINSVCMKLYKRHAIENKKLTFNEKYDIGEDLLFNIGYYSGENELQIYNSGYYIINKRNGSLTRKKSAQLTTLKNVRLECIDLLRRKKLLTKKCDKALEYIGIKNMISSIKKQEIRLGEGLTRFRINTQHYILYNSIRATAICNAWRILCICKNKLNYFRKGTPK